MKQVFFALMISGSLVFASSTTKTTKTTVTKTTTTEASMPLIHTAELAKMMDTKSTPVYIFDANTEETRKADGLIPGAKALASVTAYDTAILPADKNASLVFYCANTKCMASHEAAQVAMKNGYKNVMVMADGIQGWKKDGKAVEKYSKN